MEALDRQFNATDPFNADRSGRLRWVDGELTINFGKKKGERVKDLVTTDPGYLKWILRGDFVWQRQRVIAEYQGDVHRIDRKTWQDGFIRRRLAEDNGWAMVEFTARDIFAKTPQRELVATLSRLLGSRPRPGA